MALVPKTVEVTLLSYHLKLSFAPKVEVAESITVPTSQREALFAVGAVGAGITLSFPVIAAVTDWVWLQVPLPVLDTVAKVAFTR